MKQLYSIICVALLHLLFATPCLAKNDLPELKPFKEKNAGQVLLPIMKKDKWGFANSEGKVLIKPEFEGATDFVDGIACIKYGGKWGLINTVPSYVLLPAYDEIRRFKDDLAIVMNNGKYGIIDKQGRVRLPAEYDEIKPDTYFSGITLVRKGTQWDFIDTKTGMLKYQMGYTDVITNDGPYAIIKKGDKWGLLNKDIKYVSSVSYDQLKYNSKGYYVVQQNGLYGVLSTQIKYILPCEFTEEPDVTSDVKAFFANGKVYLSSTKETNCWVLNYNFNDSRMSPLSIASGSLLIEQKLNDRTKLAIYDNIPAFITRDGKCVWAANDNIKRLVNSPVSMDYKEDSISVTNYFRANSNGDTYSMVQDVNIKYPASASDFRFPAAKIQKTIFQLCTKQDLVTPTQVTEYYIAGLRLGESNDLTWVPVVEVQVSQAKNRYKASLICTIDRIDNGVMYVKISRGSYKGDTPQSAESTVYPISLTTGELMSNDKSN